MSRRYRGLSDAQANAEALARRGSPYSGASGASFHIAWDYRQREPGDLREAVRMVRKAYADEVPDKLHDGPDAIGEDGTPRFAARAAGYIFGSAEGSDARPDPETGEPPLVSYYYAPFRATLARMSGSRRESHRKHGAIVAHITIGQQDAVTAAMAEGVPSWCAGSVAELALRAFLGDLSDVRVHLKREREALPEGVTAA